MNDFLSIFFISLILMFFILGMIYTLNQKYKFKKLLMNEKQLYNLDELEITETESLGGSYWIGNLTIYKNYIHIERGFILNLYSHFIVNSKHFDSEKNMKGTITIKDSTFSKEKGLRLKGVKHRVFHNSNITIRVKDKNVAGLEKVNNLINTHFLN